MTSSRVRGGRVIGFINHVTGNLCLFSTLSSLFTQDSRHWLDHAPPPMTWGVGARFTTTAATTTTYTTIARVQYILFVREQGTFRDSRSIQYILSIVGVIGQGITSHYACILDMSSWHPPTTHHRSIVYPQCVHSMYIVYPLYIHSMSIVCTQYVHGMYIVCAWYVYSMSMVCIQYVYSMYQLQYQLYTRGVSIQCTSYIVYCKMLLYVVRGMYHISDKQLSPSHVNYTPSYFRPPTIQGWWFSDL